MFAIEPIGAIGQPRPEEHAFLPMKSSNETILRVVWTHIQVVNASIGGVIDEQVKTSD